MPFYHFHLDVPLPPDEVLRRFHGRIREEPTFSEQFKNMWRGTGPDTNMFCGTVEGDKFSLHRNIYYRNSFLPDIKGRVFSFQSGSRVSVTMHMPTFTIIFLTVVFTFLGVEIARHPVGANFFGVIVFLSIALGGFLPEVVIAKRLVVETVFGRPRR